MANNNGTAPAQQQQAQAQAQAQAQTQQQLAQEASPSAVERVAQMTLEEVAALLAQAGRKTAIVEGPDGKPRVRREKARAVIGGKGDTAKLTLTLGQLLAAAAAVPALLAVAFLLWWQPRLTNLGGGVAAGVLVGLGLAFAYNRNRKAKEQTAQVLAADPGLKGCAYLLGGVPAWIALTDREKMEWFNRLLSELWPYYDRGICRAVREAVEPIMEQYRPPGIIKRIFFQELTFGNAPLRVEGIAVKEEAGEIDLEVDVRWSGDANICLGIDLPVGGDLTRLNPKVTDIVFVATFKVILKPLVRKVPGFAAMALALKGPPIINYRLNFGTLSGGSVTTAPITAFVNFIVKEVLVGMLVWPKRITVPILSSNGVLPANDPAIDLECERLMGRVRGVVRVDVIRAKGLKAYDVTGTSDPLVEVFTTPNFRYATRHARSTLEPAWNETFYLPVLEKDQVLHVEMFDRDAVNVSGVASTVQVWKSVADSFGAKEFMGRCAVKLAPLIAEGGGEAPAEDEQWHALGRGEWTNPIGTGKGEGLIRLGLQYRPIDAFSAREVQGARAGLLLVGVLGARNLRSPKGDQLTSYAKLKLGKQDYKTPNAAKSASPRWGYDNKFVFYGATLSDELVVTVCEPALAADDELGAARVRLPDLAEASAVSRWTGKEQPGYQRAWLPLGDGDGAEVELEVEFLPNW